MIDSAAPIIAIDGPSGAGKGTLCAWLAEQLGWHLLDSGALYRLTGLAAERAGVALDNEEALSDLAVGLDIRFKPTADSVVTYLNDEDVSSTIRTEEVGRLASKVAALSSVREALLQRQFNFQMAPGLVADGRDMGTVVFPTAPLKVFLTASAEERGRRRYEQLRQRGVSASLRALISDIQARDQRDSERTVAPLRPADDAIVIDSTTMSIEQVCEQVMGLVRDRALG